MLGRVSCPAVRRANFSTINDAVHDARHAADFYSGKTARLYNDKAARVPAPLVLVPIRMLMQIGRHRRHARHLGRSDPNRYSLMPRVEELPAVRLHCEILVAIQQQINRNMISLRE